SARGSGSRPEPRRRDVPAHRRGDGEDLSGVARAVERRHSRNCDLGEVTIRLVLLTVVAAVACKPAPYNGIEATGSPQLVEVDVSPMVPARVTRVWHEEGDRVQRGDTLLTLTQATLPSEIGARRASVASADARLKDLLAGSRPAEVGQAEANVRTAEAEAVR